MNSEKMKIHLGELLSLLGDPRFIDITQEYSKVLNALSLRKQGTISPAQFKLIVQHICKRLETVSKKLILEMTPLDIEDVTLSAQANAAAKEERLEQEKKNDKYIAQPIEERKSEKKEERVEDGDTKKEKQDGIKKVVTRGKGKKVNYLY